MIIEEINQFGIRKVNKILFKNKSAHSESIFGFLRVNENSETMFYYRLLFNLVTAPVWAEYGWMHDKCEVFF